MSEKKGRNWRYLKRAVCQLLGDCFSEKYFTKKKKFGNSSTKIFSMVAGLTDSIARESMFWPVGFSDGLFCLA
jgi:hypothetical protein